MKNYEHYDYIHDTELRALGGVSLLIRKYVHQSKIDINTCLRAIAVLATLHKTVSICSLYISPHDSINEKELNNLIKQLPKPFILIEDFNSHNIIWSKTTNKRGKTLENTINLCLQQQKFQIHLEPSTSTFSAINLTLSDPAIFIEYNGGGESGLHSQYTHTEEKNQHIGISRLSFLRWLLT